MRTTASLFALLLAAAQAPAETPPLYREVTSIHWVVGDLDRVSTAWGKLGFPVVQDFGEVTLPVRYAGEPATAVVRVAQARVGSVDVF